MEYKAIKTSEERDNNYIPIKVKTEITFAGETEEALFCSRAKTEGYWWHSANGLVPSCKFVDADVEARYQYWNKHRNTTSQLDDFYGNGIVD